MNSAAEVITFIEEPGATAAVKANSMVAQSLFNRAVKGDGAAATSAAIFWLKARAGWRERVVQEHTGPDGEGPPSLQVVFVGAQAQGKQGNGLNRLHKEVDAGQVVLEPPRLPTTDGGKA